jgi:hypothetical protein
MHACMRDVMTLIGGAMLRSICILYYDILYHHGGFHDVCIYNMLR